MAGARSRSSSRAGRVPSSASIGKSQGRPPRGHVEDHVMFSHTLLGYILVQAVQVVRERSTRERGLADAPHQWLWEV